MKMMITIKQNKGTKQKKIEESERKKNTHFEDGIARIKKKNRV